MYYYTNGWNNPSTLWKKNTYMECINMLIGLPSGLNVRVENVSIGAIKAEEEEKEPANGFTICNTKSSLPCSKGYQTAGMSGELALMAFSAN